jgi:stearoyl-CoA desaturase (delta-9 desaturase)
MQPAVHEPIEPALPHLRAVPLPADVADLPIDSVPAAPAAAAPRARRLEWVSIAFLTLTPIVGILGTTLWTLHVGLRWWMPTLCAVIYLFVGLAICAGYHRYFSHKTYECSPVVQGFYAVFGAMAAQNTILAWSSGHRRHHRHVDDDWDPYNIKRGFWWAHILWIFVHEPQDLTNVPDLKRNPIAQWQERWYRTLLIVGGLGIPTAIGALFGDPLSGLLWGGFLRIVLTHHSTFFVNSLAHSWGARRYDAEVSACDNWAVALLTLGEGYHSFHHKFPGDYRNGVRWYQWDPAKWFIKALELVGMAERLKRVPDERIEGAELTSAVHTFEQRLERAPAPLAGEVRRRLADARAALDRATRLRREELQAKAQGRAEARAASQRTLERELRVARREWRSALRMLARAPHPA